MADPTSLLFRFEDTNSRQIITTSFAGVCTVHLWGAGGGGGGNDSSDIGGDGSPGLYNSTSFSFNKDDIIEVAVGAAGAGGNSNSGGAAGGSGGKSRINLNGDPTKSFNGGNGSAAGPRPFSGGGGGGGGATVIIKNNIVVCVAGGGGGGGGAGNDGNGSGPTTRRTGTAANNVTGQSGSDYRGQNGQTKTGDGGGGGGGGGGFPGGTGGAVVSGDASAFAGKSGGNFPATTGIYENQLLYPRGGIAPWSSFMNSYAVWVTPTGSGTGTYTVYRVFSAPTTGQYNVRFSADNTGTLEVGSLTPINRTRFDVEPNTTSITLNKGLHILKFTVANSGGPGGFAATIQDTAGSILWDTRSATNIASPGEESIYYKKGKATGGRAASSGRPGYAVLIFTPLAVSGNAPPAVKVSGQWRQTTNSWVKVDGVWREIDTTYVKINGIWRPIQSAADQATLVPVTNTSDIGNSIRSYT